MEFLRLINEERHINNWQVWFGADFVLLAMNTLFFFFFFKLDRSVVKLISLFFFNLYENKNVNYADAKNLFIYTKY